MAWAVIVLWLITLDIAQHPPSRRDKMTLDFVVHKILIPTGLGFLILFGCWLVVVFFIWIADKWSISVLNVRLPPPPRWLTNILTALAWFLVFWLIGLFVLAKMEV